MSRAVRRQLLESLEGLQEANCMLTTLLRSGDREEFFSLLENCQECAMAIGTRIDAVYGEETKSVQELEEYCEAIYRISQTGEVNEAIRLCEGAQGQLETVKERMETEIPNRLEVVFLPYNVTMWDSLESIWMAAKEDANCDDYVIPIPYFDKDKNGRLAEEHYDGNEYPKYVPIVHYSAYDFEQRQPDIIFIHNPYDGGNKVTSVHPFFYSKNLKRFTNMLVYVPYFVLEGNGISESLVLNTGVVNADYVIVRSEKEKEDYIRHFQKHYPQLNIADKLQSLGSPKLDRVRRVLMENVSLPQDWLERCSGKKVILYNTNIVGILHGNKQYLKKMESVFDFFKNREDMVLLWRPHPLMEQTIVSMRGELYEEYMEQKRRFMIENIGIYDECRDAYPAMVVSDIYYGDASSLIWLFKETGKIVKEQDVCYSVETEMTDILTSANEHFEDVQTTSIESISKIGESFGKRIYLYILNKLQG